MTYVVLAKKLRKNFSNHLALDNVSFSLKKGTIFGLLGPNGAGKTTLIRIINGIINADGGSVKIDGKEVSDLAQLAIGYLPEERGLYKKMKVEEHLIYLGQLKNLSKKEAKEKTTHWLEKFGIDSWKNKTIEELSKGMAQKVQFIATVLHDPKLLILDEPFSGFDPINTELIKKEILELQEKGTSIILSTHNMNSVEELCDELALLNEGKILLQGSMTEIKKRFQNNQFELIFSGNMISLTAALWTGFELIKHEKLENNRLKVVVAGTTNNNINELLTAILPTCKVWEVKELIPSMNEIFIQQITADKQLVND